MEGRNKVPGAGLQTEHCDDLLKAEVYPPGMEN